MEAISANATMAEATKANKPQTGWLTKIALVAFAAVALADLTGCAALKNSADTLGNAAGTQVTKGGMWLMGKDVDCNFDATNQSAYSPGKGGNSGTNTHNVCREVPSAKAQMKQAEQQEALHDFHMAAQRKRAEEEQAYQQLMFRKMNAEMLQQQAIDTCHRREIDLLGQGKSMAPTEGCVPILQKAKAQLAEQSAPAKEKSSSFWDGFHLKQD